MFLIRLLYRFSVSQPLVAFHELAANNHERNAIQLQFAIAAMPLMGHVFKTNLVAGSSIAI
jgi:hypothetical protein